MNIIGIIPARYASVRFPGKPLADIAGKPMIRRVYEQALKTPQLSEVIVATDDERIVEAVESFGGKAMMTASSHQSGTDRCAEVARAFPAHDVVINIQGDEPFIDPVQIGELCSCFRDVSVQLASLFKRIASLEELHNPNLPKVVMNEKKEAIYFSRSPIPYLRGVEASRWLETRPFYKHIGIYGYRRETLLALTKLPPSALEQAEALEQLRWLENGYTIRLTETHSPTYAIDTPQDLERTLKSIGKEGLGG